MVQIRAYLSLHPRAKRHRLCQAVLDHLGRNFDLYIDHSTYSGRTREFAREVALEHGANDTDGVLVSAGGDGTFHELTNGWIDGGRPRNLRLAPLPLGSGNDFLLSVDRRLSRLPTYLHYPLTAARDATLGRVWFQTPLGEDSRYFCVGATAGLSAVVTARRALLASRFPGSLSYLIALLLSLRSWQNRAVRLESSQEPFYSPVFLNFNAANVRHYGGGMISSPQADPFQGAIHTVSMNITLGQAIKALPENFRGRFERVANVHLARRNQPFALYCDPACPVQADGELLGATPMRVEAIPGGLPLLLPRLPGQ